MLPNQLSDLINVRWCLNSKQAALQLILEGSRGVGWDREKLPPPDSHVYGENGAETVVYNMKRNSKKMEEEK